MHSRPNDLTFQEIKALVVRPNPIVLEIGAHDGTDSLNFLSTFPGVRLHCFEPDPRAIAKWKMKVNPNRAKLYEVALSSETGSATFYQSGGSPRPGVDNWDHSSSLSKPTGHLIDSPWCTFNNQIVVQTTTLDEWEKAHNFGYVDFIWMDVQGKEGAVLLGGAKTIAKTRFVKLECHRQEMYEGQWTEGQFIEHLNGWTCLGRCGNDLLFRNDEIGKAA